MQRSYFIYLQIILKHESVVPGSHALRDVYVRQAGTWGLWLECL